MNKKENKEFFVSKKERLKINKMIEKAILKKGNTKLTLLLVQVKTHEKQRKMKKKVF